ncbi:hypothetical protein GPM19_03775 [Halomonas sp. ZH2S]|uniref:Uncharacterized protein n=1 Tax=Vreelandella zhuhanensis TaxID=2684210 RepID=A0A7X3GYM6_9GAMM|nr:hypothetical protein [Halomonas zhuhanensis]MWJ27332.1 hypothetical protein [Halomonas zhuhanensis]
MMRSDPKKTGARYERDVDQTRYFSRLNRECEHMLTDQHWDNGWISGLSDDLGIWLPCEIEDREDSSKNREYRPQVKTESSSDQASDPMLVKPCRKRKPRYQEELTTPELARNLAIANQG